MTDTMTDTATDPVAALADAFAFAPPRSPVLGGPADHGLDHENVSFPAEDGVPLEGWFVPAPSARGVVVVNHPRGFSRTGLPSHLEPWRSLHAPTGNDVEVDFVPDIALLHRAGYHVLAYDLRNSGLSGDANGRITSSGLFESRDVVGSLDWVRGRSDLAGLPVALFSRCLGANATMFAMRRRPAAFAEVRALVACQPLSRRHVAVATLARLGLPAAAIDDVDRAVALRSGFALDDGSPIGAARAVTVPTLLYQVRDDVMTVPDDVAAVYDAVGAADKELFWIEGSTRRWDGYLHFQRDPDRILRWLHDRTG